MERIDFTALGDSLLRDAESLLAQWFPHGRQRGHEFVIGNINGEPGDSLSINTTTGRWADFGNPAHKGGDLISLYAAHRGLTQLDAARELSGQAARMLAVPPARPKQERKPQKWTPVLPVPADTPAPPDRFARKEGDRWVDGEFIRRWTYHDADGLILGHVERYEWPKVDPETGEIVGRDKDVVPRTWCKNEESGKSAWRTRSFPVPRPLYGLRELAERPTAPVLIVEGEKSADAARLIAKQYVVIAWPGGIEAWRKAALNPLRGRSSVLLWPDADEPGVKGMWEVGHELLKLVPTVKIILPAGKPDGWDAADALAEGWGWQQFKEWALPLAKLVQEQGTNHGTSDSRGSEAADEGGAGRAAAQRGDEGRKPDRNSGRPDERGDAGSAGGADAEPGAEAHSAASAPATVGDDGTRPAPGDASDGGRAAGHHAVDRGPEKRPGGDRGGIAAPAECGASGDRDAGIEARFGSPVDEGRGSDAELRAADAQREPRASTGTEVAPAAQQEPQSQVSRWLAWGLDRNGNGLPLTNLNNAVAVLENDPRLQGLVWFDEFLQRMLTGEPAREWGEADDANLTLYMQRALGLQKMGVDTVRQAARVIAYRNVRNCARDWMASLKHDGGSRIDHFLIDVFGADDNDYVRAAGRNFWISIAARTFQPGCQVDNMLVLEGLQGKGKSSAVQVIGGEWYAAQHESPTNMRAFAEVLQGKIIVEIEEMHAFSRSETEAVKKAVTVRKDRFRPSGAHGYAKDHPRTCIFAGTTNRDDWNKDETGARRFWPIRCSMVDIDLLQRNREQYFAEAVARFKAGETWWEMPEEQTKAEQQDRYDADPWMEEIAKFVEFMSSVTVNEIMQEALKIDIARFTRSDQMRVATCLRVLGWGKPKGGKATRRGNKVVQVWYPPQKVTTDTEVATAGRNAQVVDSSIPF